jgi:hypothetical protein
MKTVDKKDKTLRKFKSTLIKFLPLRTPQSMGLKAWPKWESACPASSRPVFQLHGHQKLNSIVTISYKVRYRTKAFF